MIANGTRRDTMRLMIESSNANESMQNVTMAALIDHALHALIPKTLDHQSTETWEP